MLGVTGAVGAGKSTVCAALAGHGFAVLDVDVVASEVLAAGVPEVAALLPELGGAPSGPAVLRAILDRPALRPRVEAAARPYVEARIRAWRAALTTDGALDAALLFEQGLDALCDATWCVTCPADERRLRVGARATTSARTFDAIEAAQWPEAEKARRADDVVEGAAEGVPLEARVREALGRLRARPGWAPDDSVSPGLPQPATGRRTDGVP